MLFIYKQPFVMIKLKFFFITCLSLSLIACQEETDDNRLNELQEENERLRQNIEEQTDEVNYYFEALNKIEDNLKLIQLKEKGIVDRTRNVEDGKTQEEAILEDVKEIYELMEENQATIAKLEQELSNSNMQIDQFKKKIANLQAEIEKRDQRILELEEQLESINVSIGIIYEAYMEQKQLSNYQDSELHKAYYAFGSKKELKEKNIITREGGFIGIGGAKQLADDFNEDYFKSIDIRETIEIPLFVKKAEIITTHSEKSYELVSKDNQIQKIKIKDPDEFWKASKYLVIVVK